MPPQNAHLEFEREVAKVLVAATMIPSVGMDFSTISSSRTLVDEGLCRRSGWLTPVLLWCESVGGASILNERATFVPQVPDMSSASPPPSTELGSTISEISTIKSSLLQV